MREGVVLYVGGQIGARLCQLSKFGSLGGLVGGGVSVDIGMAWHTRGRYKLRDDPDPIRTKVHDRVQFNDTRNP